MALDRDNASYGYKAPTPTVDASDAAEKARIAAMRKANTKSRPATFLEQVESQIAKTTARLADAEAVQTQVDAANPSAMKKRTDETNSEFNARVKAAEVLARKNAMAENPLLNKAVKPTDAPAGKYYAWIGGTNTGSWQLYDVPGYGANGDDGGNADGSSSNNANGNSSNNNNGASATTYTAPDGKIFTDLNAYNTYIADLKQQELTKAGQSAYDLLFTQFNQYGMGALVEPLKQFIQQGLSSSEFTLRLRDTDAYKKRFAANAQRTAKGLSALNEAEYIGLEDQYQNIMRQYGLPASYYTRGDMGRQEGFEKFLANDVSAAELEDRVMTAQSRVTNANPEVLSALKQFYPGIGDGDILAYTLNPEKALTDIKRKITAAEIGGAAMQRGLGTNMTRAEELGAAGVTKQQAQQGYGVIASGLQRGSQLAAIYGESPYTQTTAESEVFNIAGSTEAEKQRKKLTSLEKATFSGQTGVSSSALVRDRAGAY